MAQPDAQPLRVLHVLDSLALAGMEYGVIKLVNRLDPSRFRPMICCLRAQSKATVPLIHADIPVFEMNRNEGRDWQLVPRLAALMRRNSIDVVHSHNWATLMHTVLAARRAPRPIVIHGEHGREAQQIPWKQTLASLFLARFTSHVTTVSQALAGELIQQWRLRRDRVSAVPNGVDLDRFGEPCDSSRLRDELGIEADQRVVLSIGRLRPVKDYPTLLRAFASVQSAHPRSCLVILGDDFGTGTRSGLVELARELGIGAATQFLASRQDVPELLQLADIYVNSSIFEGMSNTILEAMAARRPVVATAVGGNPELVADQSSGYLFPSGDPDALARRLCELLADQDLRERMGREGRNRVEQQHSMAGMVERYAGLYETCFERDRGRKRPRIER